MLTAVSSRVIIPNKYHYLHFLTCLNAHFDFEMRETQTRPSSVPPVPKARTARDSITNNMGAINLDFIQLTSKLLNDIIHTYAQEIDRMKQELVLIENSRLHINRKGTHVFFRSRPFGEDKDVSITHDRNRIHLLARRAYLENTISFSLSYKVTNNGYKHRTHNLRTIAYYVNR